MRAATALLIAALALAAGAVSPLAESRRLEAAFDALVAAYPDALAGHDSKVLRWRDGTVMPLFGTTVNETFAERLRHASLADQMNLSYPRGPLATPPATDADPGRFRNAAFFEKMYGDCRKDEVTPHLVTLPWLPHSWGKLIRITAVNGVAKELRAVSAEIDALPDRVKRAAYPIAGTYKCRAVADTGQPSPHGYGIAIDLNIAFSDYWYWRAHRGPIVYRNRMPQQIVTIFENHGFIWGGKWYHYDTMHFEYRPELLPPSSP